MHALASWRELFVTCARMELEIRLLCYFLLEQRSQVSELRFMRVAGCSHGVVLCKANMQWTNFLMKSLRFRIFMQKCKYYDQTCIYQLRSCHTLRFNQKIEVQKIIFSTTWIWSRDLSCWVLRSNHNASKAFSLYAHVFQVLETETCKCLTAFPTS